MDYLLIEGGRKLRGEITAAGSKNAALPELFASLLSDDKIMLENVPRLEDIKTAASLLEIFGKRVTPRGHIFEISKDGRPSFEIPYDLVRKMRASILMAGPALARYGKIRISLPGGCAIGVRPIDIHLDGFRKMGASVDLRAGYVEMTSKKLRPARIALKFPSVGATENLVMAAALTEGTTVIENAAREPEISDLCAMLSSMGAGIEGAGDSTVRVTGAKKLSGARHKVIPDRIEAATYLIAAAITGGKIKLMGAQSGHLAAVVGKLREAGMKINDGDGFITAAANRPLRPVNITTDVYPGFPTDIQAQWMALMSVVKGDSRISETVFENRFLHVAELKRLGARLRVKGNTVHVSGVKRLSGAPVMVSDLRAGAALVLAALAAEGKSKILRIYHLDRGYENLVGKLVSLGASIKRLPQ